ncbi:MAG: MATE family efflux transporter [Oscillospiraceae bacterium]|nr:MATE family efflux transporter [Oscillospiraceae bacterium]
MTKGKPFPVIIRFCVPIVLGSLFQQVYNLADAVIVGHFIGMEEMGAVMSMGSLIFLIIGFVMGLTTGFSIPIARSFGAGNVSEMRRYAANSFYLCGVLAALLTALTVVFARRLLVIMQTPPEIIDAAYNYIIILMSCITVTMAYNILVALLRALGDSKTPLFFLIFSCGVNIILDFVFIVVLELGTRGVGLATIISQAFAVVLCLIHIRRNFPVLYFRKEETRLSRSHSGKLLKNGVPMALQFSITAVGGIILQSAVNALGAVTVSAVGVASRIQIFIMQPMEALGITMATFCAQNLGKKKIHRIIKGIKIGMASVLVYSIFGGLVIIFFGRYIAALFINADVSPEDVSYAMDCIKNFQIVNGSLYWLLGILFILRYSVQGLGYSGVTLFAGVSELFARAGVALILAPLYGFRAICFANPMSWLFADLLLAIIFIIVMKKMLKNLRHFGSFKKSSEEKNA